MHSSGAVHEPSWLGTVRSAYAIIDADVARAEAARGRAGERLACAKGCVHCCVQPVPLTPPEVTAIAWYLSRVSLPEHRNVVLEAAAREGESWACPLLHDGGCLVYDVRPVTCRRYSVVGRPCRSGEDPVAERPGDMLESGIGALGRAQALLLSLTGVAPQDMRRALADGELLRQTVLAQSVDWRQAVRAWDGD